jgi:outer membrane cobalamin receptor
MMGSYDRQSDFLHSPAEVLRGSRRPAWGITGIVAALAFLTLLPRDAMAARVADDTLTTRKTVQSDSVGADHNTLVSREGARETEHLSDIPGGSTIFEREKIQQSGYSTLADLATLASGYSSTEDAYANRTLVTRGYASANNSDHLVLIEGIPINSSIDGRAPVQHEVPLYFVKRVEFLQRPSALQYGDHTLSGAINISPENLATQGPRADAIMGVGVESGSPDDIAQRKRELLVHRNQWNGFDITRWAAANILATEGGKEVQLSVGYHSREASLKYGHMFNEQTGRYDQSQPRGPYKNDGTAYFGRLQARVTTGLLEGLGAGFIGLYRRNGYGLAWAATTGKASVSNNLILSSAIPYARFDRMLNERTRINAAVIWNASQNNGWQENDIGWWGRPDTNAVSTYDIAATDLACKANISLDLLAPLTLVAGIAYDMNGQDSTKTWLLQTQNIGATPAGIPLTTDSIIITRGSRHTYSGYIQARAKIPLLNGLFVNAGLRLDNSNWKAQVWHQALPSAAFMLKINESLNAQASYSTGFIAPELQDYEINRRLQATLEDFNTSTQNNLKMLPLKPQLQHSLEASVSFAKARVSGSVGGFHSIGGNRLERRSWFAQYLPPFVQNSNCTIVSQGLESQLTLQLAPDLQAMIGIDYTTTAFHYGANDFLPDGQIATEDVIVYNELQSMPQVKGVAGIAYTAPFGLQARATFKGIRPVAWMDRTREPETWLLDLNLVQPLGKSLSVALMCSNLLNSQNYFYRGMVPDANRTLNLSLRTGLAN